MSFYTVPGPGPTINSYKMMPAGVCLFSGQTLFVPVFRIDDIWVLCVLERRGVEQGGCNGALVWSGSSA